MLYKSVVVFGAILQFACQDSSKTYFESKSIGVSFEPYGVWSTKNGHVIVIPRQEKKFVYCNRRECLTGVADKLGPETVLLRGFVASPITQELRTVSGFDEQNNINWPGEKSPEANDLQFGNNVHVNAEDVNVCGNAPCHVLGNVERAQTRFLKVEDF